MTQLDGELSPPFEILEPATWRAPIIFNSPHSGSVYPHEFLNASRIDLAALRRSEDSLMDELIAGLSGGVFRWCGCIPLYVDVNRGPTNSVRGCSSTIAELRQYRSMRVRRFGTIPAWWATDEIYRNASSTTRWAV